MDWIKLSLEACLLGVPSGASKMISEPMVCLAQTMHLSCTDANSTSKWTETRLYMTYITKEFHRCVQNDFRAHGTFGANLLSCVKISTISKRVCPKWLLSIWYVWCNLCTYFAPTLTLSPNGPKRVSTWPKSPSCYFRCVQNNFWAYGMFGTNRAPILQQH
jgi:hypothetical protein